MIREVWKPQPAATHWQRAAQGGFGWERKMKISGQREGRMSELDLALERLGDAVVRLIDSAGHGQTGAEAEARLAELTAERDRLLAEVEDLRAQREVDAKLRDEAAEAVRDALSDLRGLLAAQEGQQEEAANG